MRLVIGRAIVIIAALSIYSISFAQEGEFVGDARYPDHQLLMTTPISIYNFHDTVFVLLTYNQWNSYAIHTRYNFRESIIWNVRYSGVSDLGVNQFEYFVSNSGQSFIYADYYDSLLTNFQRFGGNPESKYCPGRPVIDSLNNIHVMWIGPDSTYYYGFSNDTLRTLNHVDTLRPFPRFVSLISSPGNSIVSALFYNDAVDSLFKYVAPAGSSINFEHPAGAFEFTHSLPYPKDITLDYNGDIIFVYFWGAPPQYYHQMWSERNGASFVNYAVDDVSDGITLQFLFGPNEGELLLMQSSMYNTYFLASTDGGASWRPSTYSRYGLFGNAAREYSDSIDYMHYSHQGGVYYYRIPRDSIFANLVSIEEAPSPTPDKLSMSNYPNPFNSSTTISFKTPPDTKAKLAIYDLGGRKVATLFDGIAQGSKSMIWDARDSSGKSLNSGVYLCRLSLADKSITRKLIYVK